MVQKVFAGVILIILAATFMWNAWMLWEAYGPQAPYFSRTTNMDKWINPLPSLAMVNAVAFVAAISFIYCVKRAK